MSYTWWLQQPFYPVYGPEGDDDQQDDQQSEGDADDDDSNDDAEDTSKTYTKAEVEDIIKREKRKQDDNTKKTIRELEVLRKSKNITEQERDKLNKQIDKLQQQILTKEELAAKEKKKLENEYQQQLQNIEKDRNSWQDRYTNAEISRSLTDAAAANNAFNVEDIKAILQPRTTLEEEMDGDDPTGVFKPLVKFPSKDKEGKDVILDLTPKEAVKQMVNDVDRYGHLFKSTASSGLGGQGSRPKKPSDFRNMSHEEYRKHRKKMR